MKKTKKITKAAHKLIETYGQVMFELHGETINRERTLDNIEKAMDAIEAVFEAVVRKIDED
ncbi:unnamed protein product [marine sediment metagenome]|uniref:Uncharacterized protein n=1 Tax=marine sediment metagenome TaxID=412755 RepID=X1BI23_9ZZZZ